MLYTMQNDTVLAVVDSYAGTLERLYHKPSQTEHIWKYDAAYWPRRTSICFPIMSVLRDDETQIEGKMYHMENHGFLRQTQMQVVRQCADEIILRAQADDTTRKMYPYQFCFDAVYRLLSDGMQVEYRVTNDDARDMYYCVGAHTTYKIPIVDTDSMLEDMQICFAQRETADVHVMHNGFVTHEKRRILQDENTLLLNGLFDDGALIFDVSQLRSRKVTLCSRKNAHYTSVAFDGFAHLGLWTKPGTMPFLCIEPMSALADYEDAPKVLAQKPNVCSLTTGCSSVHVQRITIG